MCVIQSYGQQGSLLRKNMLMLLGLISDRSFVEGAIERVSAYPPSLLHFVREFPYTHSLLRHDFAQPALPVIGTIFWGILPNILLSVIYEVTKVRIGSHWPQNLSLFIDPSAEDVMLTRSAAVLNLLPSQFTPLLAGVIGDKKTPVGIRYQISIISLSLLALFGRLITGDWA